MNEKLLAEALSFRYLESLVHFHHTFERSGVTAQIIGRLKNIRIEPDAAETPVIVHLRGNEDDSPHHDGSSMSFALPADRLVEILAGPGGVYP